MFHRRAIHRFHIVQRKIIIAALVEKANITLRKTFGVVAPADIQRSAERRAVGRLCYAGKNKKAGEQRNQDTLHTIRGFGRNSGAGSGWSGLGKIFPKDIYE